MNETLGETNLYLAEMLRVSASAYAARATERLLDSRPACGDRYGTGAFGEWQANLVQRIHELAIAIEMDEPLLFRTQVEWTRAAFRARAVPTEDFAHSLAALQAVLLEDLPEGLGEVPGPYIEAAIEAGDPESMEPVRLGDDSEAGRIALRYVEAAISGNQRGAARVVLDAVADGLPVRDAYEQVLLPAQVEIGRMWHLDEIGIAEEHAATGTTCTVMAILAWQAAAPVGDSPLVLLAAVEGDRHDVGLRATAGLLEIGGCRTVSLGADVPTSEIVRAVEETAAGALILSATLVIHLRPLRKAIRAVRDLESGAGVQLLIGGPALAPVPHIAARLEADGYLASPAEALAAIDPPATAGTRR